MQALAPLSNKLRALLGNRALRNMLCQPAAPDLHGADQQWPLAARLAAANAWVRTRRT